ncbi:hypothetical protein GCM10023215_01060 [Pseudonocardia yuanmonensis]|uniref:Uncharacterized protein n=1 Tax=Pseudonocardia yuanmonensis TaxID=1095914 RepID=A0ABP8VX87_9PSEU
MRKNRFTHLAIATLLATAAAVGVAQPASAQGSTFTTDPGQACSFGLRVTLTGGNLEPMEVGGGQIVEAGSTGTLEITRLDTGETITFPSRGVGRREVTTTDGITTVSTGGQLLLILFPTDVPAGPSTTLYTGRVVYTVDQNGVFTVVSTAGRQVDVCAELAS